MTTQIIASTTRKRAPPDLPLTASPIGAPPTHVVDDTLTTSPDRDPTIKTAGVNAVTRAPWRRIVYRTWQRLPHWLQRRIVRVVVPSVTIGVCAVILDARGRLLLVHHTYHQQSWGLPGGFVRGDEQPPETLARELREELGVAARIGPLLTVEIAPRTGHLTLYYRATLRDGPRHDGVEINAWRYVSLPAANLLLSTPRPSWLTCVQQALGGENEHAA